MRKSKNVRRGCVPTGFLVFIVLIVAAVLYALIMLGGIYLLLGATGVGKVVEWIIQYGWHIVIALAVFWGLLSIEIVIDTPSHEADAQQRRRKGSRITSQTRPSGVDTDQSADSMSTQTDLLGD